MEKYDKNETIALLREEKNNLGRELHALLGSDLAPLVLHLTAAPEHSPLRLAGQRLAGIVNRLREIALLAGMESESHDDVTSELREYALDFAAFTGISFKFSADHLRAGKYEAFHLKRFFFEVLANAARHARARHVRVRLKTRGGFTTLLIADDGSGMQEKTGHSLKALRNRARCLKGALRIYSRPGQGTLVAMRFVSAA